jgi:hypothetical protein
MTSGSSGPAPSARPASTDAYLPSSALARRCRSANSVSPTNLEKSKGEKSKGDIPWSLVGFLARPALEIGLFARWYNRNQLRPRNL